MEKIDGPRTKGFRHVSEFGQWDASLVYVPGIRVRAHQLRIGIKKANLKKANIEYYMNKRLDKAV